MNLNDIARKCWETSNKSGFSPYDDIDNIKDHLYYLPTKIALIHSEVSEMLEAVRIDDFDNMVEEGIDVLIRTLEYLSSLKGVDIEKELQKKMEINSNRSYRHGGKLV